MTPVLDGHLDVETWTATECAAHWEISEGRWRSLVSDGSAPAALPGYDPDTGRKRWDADLVRAAAKTRPGRGRRTDLHKTTDDTPPETDNP